jgi:hypothetical protein
MAAQCDSQNGAATCIVRTGAGEFNSHIYRVSLPRKVVSFDQLYLD